MTERPLGWANYQVGMTLPEIETAGISFKRKEWDLGGEQFVGMSFSQLIPILLKESRFDRYRFNPPSWIGDFQGGIWQAYFKIYIPKPHEKTGQIRQTGTGEDEFFWPVEVLPNGGLSLEYNPLADASLAKNNLAVAFTSIVLLNNLSLPGSYGGLAHFPMLDIVHTPTPENVKRLIAEIKQRCGLQKFFVLRSSDHGMMVVGPELFDQENFVAFLMDSLLLNHMEDAGEFWVDDRWIAYSTQRLVALSGNRINPLRYGADLRITALPPGKPEEPTIIASSF